MPIIPALASHAATVFAIGALAFGSMQLLQRYDGPSVVIRRLRRQQILADFLLMFSAALLVMQRDHIGPIALRGDEWKVTLLIAAILELYTAFRIPAELDKEQRPR